MLRTYYELKILKGNGMRLLIEDAPNPGIRSNATDAAAAPRWHIKEDFRDEVEAGARSNPVDICANIYGPRSLVL